MTPKLGHTELVYRSPSPALPSFRGMPKNLHGGRQQLLEGQPCLTPKLRILIDLGRNE